ncbi:hypothetical protein INP83_11425 [Mucilaginibacter sp. 21P]|uniref:hypothetical protein n=1 Tax=Mucilaginibacter sp. 21P TaxID=2778902 RepID=UPI001C57488F|nr:hypothetical protein [Mucilaginibacter sp. 21P]QXV63719.1 hypothetical protein INP83_11425 [Mucilaginibacter sp. 21P]
MELQHITDFEDTLTEDLGFIVSAVTQLYKVYANYKDNLIPGLKYMNSKKFIPLVVTLEDWFAGGPDTDDVIKAGVEAELIKNGIDREYMIEFPFKTYSINQLELDLQLIFSLGFIEYFERLKTGKISEEERHKFPYIDYFTDEFNQVFLDPIKE